MDNSPEAVIAAKASSSSAIQFPSNLNTNIPYIHLVIYKYQYKYGVTNIVTGDGVGSAAEKTIVKDIFLPFPQQVSTNYGGNWGEDELSQIGNVINSASTRDVSDTLGTVGAYGTRAVGRALDDNGIGAYNTEAGVRTGITQTPLTELLYSGPQRRSFSFSYEFSPRNQTETQILLNLRDELRAAIHPTTVAGLSFLKYPEIIGIYIEPTQAEKFFFRVDRAAIKSLQFDFNDDSPNRFMRKDLAPSKVSMSIQFEELELLFKDGEGAAGPGRFFNTTAF